MHWFNSYLKLLNVNDGGVIRSFISSLTGLTLYWFYIPWVKPFSGRKSWHLVGGTLKILMNFKGFFGSPISGPSSTRWIFTHPMPSHAGLRPSASSQVFFQKSQHFQTSEFCFKTRPCRGENWYQKSAGIPQKTCETWRRGGKEHILILEMFWMAFFSRENMWQEVGIWSKN